MWKDRKHKKENVSSIWERLQHWSSWKLCGDITSCSVSQENLSSFLWEVRRLAKENRSYVWAILSVKGCSKHQPWLTSPLKKCTLYIRPSHSNSAKFNASNWYLKLTPLLPEHVLVLVPIKNLFAYFVRFRNFHNFRQAFTQDQQGRVTFEIRL